MTGTQVQAEVTLFNNSFLSDVTIRQVYKGTVKEYYAHKAILCLYSKWFRTAFSGNFKEASDRIIEVYDDSPVHFEIMLKYLYNLEWTYTPDGDKLEKLLLDPICVYALADKYDIPGLRARSAQIFPELGHGEYTIGAYEKMIEAHYGQCAKVDSEIGCKIAALLLSTSRRKSSSTRGFIKSESFSALAKKYPIFAADLVLQCRKSDGCLF